MTNVILSGIGSYIPTQTVQNKDFLQTSFYEVNGEKITLDNETIIRKFNAITGIEERRSQSRTIGILCFKRRSVSGGWKAEGARSLPACC